MTPITDSREIGGPATYREEKSLTSTQTHIRWAKNTPRVVVTPIDTEFGYWVSFRSPKMMCSYHSTWLSPRLRVMLRYIARRQSSGDSTVHGLVPIALRLLNV